MGHFVALIRRQDLQALRCDIETEILRQGVSMAEYGHRASRSDRLGIGHRRILTAAGH